MNENLQTRSPGRSFLLAAYVLGGVALVWTFLPLPSSWVESWYARGVYPWLAAAWVRVTDLAPFPVGFYLSIAVVVGLLPALSLAGWVRGRRRGVSRWRLFWRGHIWVGALALAGYVLFLLFWGANYRRVPLSETLGLSDAPASKEEVEDLARRAVEGLRRDFVPPPERDGDTSLAALRESLAREFGMWFGERPVLPRRVKRLPAGTLLAFGNSGMLYPLTLEPYVDGGLPEVAYLAVGAHELAHVAGIAREGEADFAAMLAGLNCEDRYARYAILLKVYSRLRRELASEIRAELDSLLPAGARRDYERIAEAARRYRRRSLSRVQRRVFDAHLKMQGLSEGVRDYSRAVKLAVAASRKGLVRWPPLPRPAPVSPDAESPRPGAPEDPPR